LVAYLRTIEPAQVYVWRGGLDEWKLIQDVPELACCTRPQPSKRETVSIAPDIEPRLFAHGVFPKKYKSSWAKIGALIGLVARSADLIFEWRGRTFEAWDTAPAYNFGYVASCGGLPAFIGFILGAIRDALRASSDGAMARPTEPALDDNVRFKSVIARHWQGELPLWASYWIFGFLGNVAVALIPIAAVAIFNTDKGYDPSSIFYATIVVWAGALLVAVWQMLGVWRSATRYTAARAQLGQRALWGTLAKIVIILGVLRLAGAVASEGLPQLGELYRIAFDDGPDIRAYSIRVMRDGTEAEIVGGFKYGLTNDFGVVTKANRQIKVVHLDSIGGRLGVF
jgi:hypothetical protein